MTNEELNNAIDTVAKHSNSRVNNADIYEMLRAHLADLLAIQLQRAAAAPKCGGMVDISDLLRNIKY